MNPLTAWFEWPVVGRLGWTLLHSLWQGLLVAGLLAFVLGLLRRSTASTRYVAGCLALLLAGVLPLATFGLLALEADPLGAHRSLASSTDRLLELSRSAPRKVLPYESSEDWSAGSSSPREALRRSLEPLLPWLVGAWLTGVTLLSLRLLVGWSHAQRYRHEQTLPIGEPWPARLAQLATRLGVRRAVCLLQSARLEVPTVIGWLRPVILVPACALTGLPAEQLEAILAHELAHIRRHDYLVNLLQTVAETMLFYHPAVWWIAAQIRQEREHCCDDWAVAVCGDRLGYARALTRLEELRHETPALAGTALGLAATGGVLLPRIRRLLGLPMGGPDRPARRLAGALVLIVLAGGGAFCGLLAATDPREPPDAAKGAQPLPLRIEIALTKAQPGLDEPVGLIVTYTNTSEKPLALWVNEHAPGEGFPAEAFIVRRGTEQTTYVIQAVDPAAGTLYLKPGMTWRRKIDDLARLLARPGVVVETGASGELPPKSTPFGRPGPYAIALRYDSVLPKRMKEVFGGPARSNEVQLNIQPAGE